MAVYIDSETSMQICNKYLASQPLRARDFKSIIWGSEDEGISPGESQAGLELQFRSIPGIITARVDVDSINNKKSSFTVKIDGKTISQDDANADFMFRDQIDLNPTNMWTPYFVHSVEIEDKMIEVSSTKMVEEILLQSCPQGKVIGPEAIPADWNALKMIQRLETLISQSVAEGWLDQGAARQLKKHLANSQAALQKGQKLQAKQAIQEFADALKQMEKEIKPSNSSPPLTQEAATLLGTNTAYLLTKF